MRDGKSRMQICEYARTTWNIGHSQIDRYRQEINEQMTKEFEVSRRTMTVELADQLTRIVERCMESNQYAVALGAVNSKAKLFNEAFNWLAEYKPNEKIEFIKFQLQGCKYTIKNNRANILGFFRRLKNLNKKL